MNRFTINGQVPTTEEPEFIGPRQVADLVFFWIKDDPNRKEFTIKDKFAIWLHGRNHENPSRFNKFCHWIYKKRCERRVTVRIDNPQE